MNAPSHTTPALNGDVTFDGDFARLHYQRRLDHPPAKVWAAITEPSQIKQWLMASSVTTDACVGGTLETVAGPSQIHSIGKILTWDPPRVYEYEWNVQPLPEMPTGERSLIRWVLAPIDGGGTLLTLTHSRLSRPSAAGFAPGWHAFLDRLVAQIAGEPLPEWMPRFQELFAAYPGLDKKI